MLGRGYNGLGPALGPGRSRGGTILETSVVLGLAGTPGVCWYRDCMRAAHGPDVSVVEKLGWSHLSTAQEALLAENQALA